MRGLDPRIHVLPVREDVDGRAKPQAMKSSTSPGAILNAPPIRNVAFAVTMGVVFSDVTRSERQAYSRPSTCSSKFIMSHCCPMSIAIVPKISSDTFCDGRAVGMYVQFVASPVRTAAVNHASGQFDLVPVRCKRLPIPEKPTAEDEPGLLVEGCRARRTCHDLRTSGRKSLSAIDFSTRRIHDWYR